MSAGWAHRTKGGGVTATIGYARATVTVTPPDGEPTTHDEVGVMIRRGRGRLHTPGGNLVRTMEPVLTVERVVRDHWRVTFTSGEVWELVKSTKDCGCR